MDKPFSIIYEEFKQGLISLINNSNLPAPVIESVLRNYLNEINVLAKNQYQHDKAVYEKTLKEQEENNKSKKD